MKIKFYRAGQNDAPALKGELGSLITVLDAVLVNGYGSFSIASITRVGGTVIVTTLDEHQLENETYVEISGADQTEYNGEHLISRLSTTSFSFSIATTPAIPATGVLTGKRAPAGFEKVFSAVNKAVYRSKDETGLRHYLQVIDDGSTTGAAREAKVRAFVSMTDIDTGEEPFPTEQQRPLGVLAYKSNVVSAAIRPWKLITDGKTFYFGACMDQAPKGLMETGGYIWWTTFGELIPTMPGDKYCSFVGANNMENQQVRTGSQNGLFMAAHRSYAGTNSCMFMPRDWANSVGAVSATGIGHGWDQSNIAGSGALFSYPHAQDNGFYMTPWLMGQRGVMRGKFPGVFEPLQGRCLNNYDIVEGMEDYPGRKFMALWGVYNGSTGMLMFDTTGPWS